MFNKMNSPQIEVLKWIGILSMLVDHAGFLFYPDFVSFRAFGRIAFPLFGYVIIHNYIFFSHNKIAYIKRLFILAVLSEPLHYILFEKFYGGVNIIFLYAMTLFSIFVIEGSCRFFEKKKFKNENIGFYLLASFIISFFMEYDIRGYLLLFSFYFLFKEKKKYIMILSFFTLIAVASPYPLYIASCLIIYPLIYLVSKIKIPTIPRSKSFFYWFYPLHIAILLLLNSTG